MADLKVVLDDTEFNSTHTLEWVLAPELGDGDPLWFDDGAVPNPVASVSPSEGDDITASIRKFICASSKSNSS